MASIVKPVLPALAVLAALAAPLIAPRDPLKQNLGNTLARPGPAHLLGTDNVGRDVLSRVIWGTRVSLLAGLVSVALAVLAGSALGLAAGYCGGYFVVAPWVSRRPAMRLLPSAAASFARERNAAGSVSAVSIPLVLRESEELFVQPEYLQSTPLHAKKDTRWLLNWSIPFASLLSGMFLLTRVRSADAEPVVVSSTKDPLAELAVVELAESAAFVCRPRALAGVVQERSKAVRITRHWRFGLHAWLTLQFRFLVFHGPSQLILRGCRGVRIERAGPGRLINQAATLGFSAEIAYGNTRCETFMSYLTGKEDLFNDLFTGDSGVFAYEETPAADRVAGIGRPLQGFADAILKAFGV